MADGRSRLDRNAFSEVVWANVTLAIGVLLVTAPTGLLRVHALQFFVWRWPTAWLAALFLGSGLMSDVGIAMVLTPRRRCVVSRWLRFFGAGLGVVIWANVVGGLLFVEHIYDLVPVYLGVLVVHARSFFVALRRF
jgi:mannose/fructose/N-acetylgalactosamine-specific phosphotransferase system component IIC